MTTVSAHGSMARSAAAAQSAGFRLSRSMISRWISVSAPIRMPTLAEALATPPLSIHDRRVVGETPMMLAAWEMVMSLPGMAELLMW